MDKSTNDFSRHVLAELESLFEEGRIDVRARREDSAVMIIDTKTGEEIAEERFPTQIQNKAVALITLLKGKSIL